ncbi:MAG: hypothetical protein OJF59_002949 [Cytophagales bacterium]|jgi:lysophospholipase L1-like esterase|nr:sialate O-acetylesterase [Bacteroidota bacterium]MBS1979606.1 sialate O-acetylesterase [Bacteroidota bacterium]WHZ09193.1 MAG: hypothetical protein OJF59_002949 [Cytophagales bacterium]
MKLTVVFLVALTGEIFAQARSYDTLPNVPEHYLKRYELFKKEPIIKNRVIMLGNSITENGDWKKLLADTTAINRGISGDVTFGVINRIKDITDRQPAKVFILIGINDLSRNTPDEIIIENIFSIVAKIHGRSPKTKIYVQSILPTNETFKNLDKKFVGKAEHILTINTQLKKYASKIHFTYLDLHSYFSDAEGRMNAIYSIDGLHLNQKGYSHWAEFIKKEKYL